MLEELSIYTTPALASRSTSKKQKQKKKRTRSKWAKAWLRTRSNLSHMNLLKHLTLELGDWYSYLRMDNEIYLRLLRFVPPHIKENDSAVRRSVTSHERLSVTLRFLATGRSYEGLKISTAISAQSFGVNIPESCAAIHVLLRILVFPKTTS
jgi:predicted exporter